MLLLQACEQERDRVEGCAREAGAQGAVRGRLDARQLVRESAFARHAVDGDRERFAGAHCRHRLDARRRRLDEREVLAPPRDALLRDFHGGPELPDETGKQQDGRGTAAPEHHALFPLGKPEVPVAQLHRGAPAAMCTFATIPFSLFEVEATSAVRPRSLMPCVKRAIASVFAATSSSSSARSRKPSDSSFGPGAPASAPPTAASWARKPAGSPLPAPASRCSTCARGSWIRCTSGSATCAARSIAASRRRCSL